MTTAPFDPFNDPILDTLPQTPVAPTVTPDKVPLVQPKLISTYTDPETGDIVDVYDDKTERIRKKGTKKLDATAAAEAAAAQRLAGKVSAFDILRRGMAANNIEGLADAAIDVIMKEDSDSGRLLALRNSPAYKKRFAANAFTKVSV